MKRFSFWIAATAVASSGMTDALIPVRLIAVGILLLARCAAATDPPAAEKPDTLWIIPHTHWEGAVFKTREEYLREGLPHIVHALRLLREHPHYTFVRQIRYGKGYYRQKLGVDVTCAWLLDTFGHHGQLPQILKLGGYKSFWFFRGVPRQDFPSEFMWEGIDGTRIPAFWLPQGYGLFYGSPATLPEFEKFAAARFHALDPNSQGPDRVAMAGADVTDPEPALADMVEQAGAHRALPFRLRFGGPREFEQAVAGRDLPVFKGELNPIFQGIYSSRIELKERMRTLERLLTTAEKLSAIASWLGAPADDTDLWRAWEPVLFNETHDQASGVMTDHVYQDVQRGYDFSQHLAGQLIDQSWDEVTAKIDTRGEGVPLVVFNPLGWTRTDTAEVEVSFTQGGVKRVGV